ncbi:MAG: LysR family transcriptional regulator [Tabrizicola sp.]|nr:LysR family transcriptional regulator [Tabrizicola sp.]
MRALPPLTALKAFEAAGRHLSFLKAAEELHLTPTAVSHQIKLLEAHCGKPLFRRRPRPLALTPAGALLLPEVTAGLDRFVAGLKAARAVQAELLRVTCTNAMTALWLLPKLPRFRADHPEIRLSIMGSESVLDLAGGEVDIALRYARQPPPGLPATLVASDRYLVVASPRLVGDGPDMLDPMALSRLPLIDAQYPQGWAMTPVWREWVKLARDHYSEVPDLTRSVAMSFLEDMHGIEAAIAGHGVAISSDLLVADALRSGTLRQVSPVIFPGYSVFAVHRPDDPRLPDITTFERWIAQQFRQGP